MVIFSYFSKVILTIKNNYMRGKYLYFDLLTNKNVFSFLSQDESIRSKLTSVVLLSLCLVYMYHVIELAFD